METSSTETGLQQESAQAELQEIRRLYEHTIYELENQNRNSAKMRQALSIVCAALIGWMARGEHSNQDTDHDELARLKGQVESVQNMLSHPANPPGYFTTIPGEESPSTESSENYTPNYSNDGSTDSSLEENPSSDPAPENNHGKERGIKI